MKGHEIINYLVREEMPDIEKVRAACHEQAPLAPANPHGYTRRPRTAVAAVIAACLLFSTVALAAAHYFGSFDRLRGIIGDERADTLTPVETVFSARFSADEFFASGFRGELVAVGGVAGNVIDVFLTLEDMTGDRLDGHFEVFASLMYGSRDSMPGWAKFYEIIDRTDCGIVTLHGRHIFMESVSGRELIFGLQKIYYNFREDTLSVDFDLGTLTEQAPAAWLWDTPILPPHSHDIDIALAGFEAAGEIRISAMGLIDGHLHIQERYSFTALNRWRGNKVHLINPQGEVVYPIRGTYDNTASVSFRIDGQGVFYNDRGYNFVVDFPFRENVFDVDVYRLSEYRLVAPFHANDEAFLGWRAGFEMEMPYVREFVFDVREQEIAYYGVKIQQIRITPLTVMICASVTVIEDIRFFAEARVQLRMTDGTIADVRSYARSMVLEESRVDSLLDFTERMFIEGGEVDLDEIEAVIIGEMVIMLGDSRH